MLRVATLAARATSRAAASGTGRRHMATTPGTVEWGGWPPLPRHEPGGHLPEVLPVEAHQGVGRAVDGGLEHHLVRRVVQLRTTPQEPGLDGLGDRAQRRDDSSRPRARSGPTAIRWRGRA